MSGPGSLTRFQRIKNLKAINPGGYSTKSVQPFVQDTVRLHEIRDTVKVVHGPFLHRGPFSVSRLFINPAPQQTQFFDKVAEQRSQGAEWHYVGPKPLDPTALSIPLQCMTAEVDKDSVPCGEPYILWKLKK